MAVSTTSRYRYGMARDQHVELLGPDHGEDRTDCPPLQQTRPLRRFVRRRPFTCEWPRTRSAHRGDSLDGDHQGQDGRVFQFNCRIG